MSATKSPRRRQADTGTNSDQQHDSSFRTPGNALAIDPRFVTCLFELDDLVEVRIIPKTKTKRSQVTQLYRKAGQLAELNKQLQERNEAGQDIYLGANPRLRAGGTAADVMLARCLFVDLDHMTVDDALRRIGESGMPEPTMTVASGHGLHAYWRLTEPMTDLTAWTDAQKALIRLLKSDPSIHDPPRIMRLPTFWNHKPPMAMSKVLDADPRRLCKLEDILRTFGTMNPESRDATESTEMTSVDSANSAGSAVSVTPSPAEIVSLCIPRQERERNACLMKLARGLKFDAGLKDRPLCEVKPIVRDWHRLALPAIGTKPFDESWCDFARAWRTALIPLQAAPVPEALALARKQLASGHLPACAEQYDSDPVRLLIGLCANLAALRPDRRFFLSCHAAGRLLGAEPKQVHRLLGMLIDDHVLSVIKTGNEHRATRYEYISGD